MGIDDDLTDRLNRLGQTVEQKKASQADGLEIAAYLSGGPLGIVSAMAVFGRWKRGA